jgi:uncharacterized protein (TIGR03032 family)
MNEPKIKDQNLNSVYTTNIPELFRKFTISLAISTYQCGKLILIRSDKNIINTHFRNFNKPMGIAVKPNRLSLGCFNTVEYFQNIPAIISKLDEKDKYDSCYFPRQTIETGNIDIHEMAWGQDGKLWIVNTKFSCLATMDPEFSFCPKWWPGFISSLAPEDRCHLNGLGMVNGLPRFVTALGTTDNAGGWRMNKRNGGILIDIVTNKIIGEGLSMPHSPRWYNNQLWVLESGEGALVTFDHSGKKRIVASLPGFTRGLDFIGPLAFIGLSQIRESSTFNNLPLIERLNARICGIYIVHIQTCQIVGFIKFEGDVQEIFAVQVLQDSVFPELLENSDELLNSCYVVPDEALKNVSK